MKDVDCPVCTSAPDLQTWSKPMVSCNSGWIIEDVNPSHMNKIWPAVSISENHWIVVEDHQIFAHSSLKILETENKF